MPFEFEPLEIPEVVRVSPEVFQDDRGFLLESYDREQFRTAGIDKEFVLDFYSQSETDVVRGLHYQRKPHQQAKLVYCSTGAVFDVAVDIREDSPTFGEYVSVRLDGSNRAMLYIPGGFAHGFAAIEAPAIMHYKASSSYTPAAQGGIRWDDPVIGIDWPVSDPTVSERDAKLPYLDERSE